MLPHSGLKLLQCLLSRLDLVVVSFNRFYFKCYCGPNTDLRFRSREEQYQSNKPKGRLTA